MALDGITVAALCSELNNKILNGRINKIAQPEEDELLLTIKMPTGLIKLDISAGASLPFLYITDESKVSPMTAPNFCMLLRKHISSGRIISIRQPSLERIIDIEIEHLNEMGDLCTKILTIELMGKYSNIIFRQPDGTIIDAIKHVSSMISSVREVLPGREYFIPKTQDKLDPVSINKCEFIEAISSKPMPLSKAIYMTLVGFSPVMAEELCKLSSLDSSNSANELDEDLLTHLWNNLTWFTDNIKNGSFDPVIVYESDQTPVEFAALNLTQYSDMTVEHYDSISFVLENFYSKKNAVSRIRQKSVDLRKIVQTLLERNVKKYDIQKKQLDDSAKKDKFKLYGELLQTYGYSCEEGAKSIEVENYYDNTMVTIPLDPQKTALMNAQSYFDKYGKLKRTYAAVSKQIVETSEEIEHLQSIMSSLNIATNEADLAMIKEELTDCGYIRRKAKKGSKSQQKSKPFHFVSSDGLDIYVGKNNYQNDELTFKFANGGDWWFHAKKMPGSHVIVKTDGKELPDQTCEEAAALAAYYSSGNNMDKLEVDYVQKREVKKPGGSKPGFVVYYTNYSMMATPKLASSLKEV